MSDEIAAAAAVTKEQKKLTKEQKKQGGDGKKKLSKEERKHVDAARQAASTMAKYGKDLKYCVGVLPAMEKDALVDLPLAVFETAAQEFRKRAPATGFMWIAAGSSLLQVYAEVPNPSALGDYDADLFNISEWVEAVRPPAGGDTDDDGHSKKWEELTESPTHFSFWKLPLENTPTSRVCFWQMAIEDGPGFKLMELCKDQAIAHLKAKDVWPDDPSSDEEGPMFGDDDEEGLNALQRIYDM